MVIKKQEEVLFAIAVYGHGHGLWPAVIYRKIKVWAGKGEDRQKEIKCPYCGQLLLTISANRRIEIIRIGKKERRNCHEYRNCHKCHKKVGIIYRAG